MRVHIQSHSINKVDSVNSTELHKVNSENVKEPMATATENEKENSKGKMQQAVDSINEIFEINNSELKFVFHEGLEEYFVQLVDSNTEEVVREIPSKKLLDVFYEMQKLVGMIVDEKI